VPAGDQHRRAAVAQLTYEGLHVNDELRCRQSAADDVVEPDHYRGQIWLRGNRGRQLMPAYVAYS